ncbi:unnamed protein product [Didymodactylos carnosus]|uniref:Uncharacterized protein n=1 Tax=Didymodactylos carnosus TaxID=1234261 RepID=A0A8S2DB05_9BILA|nr:unnamed protein product [Didymodactylos carnosus]CAF3664945.1 unnamed protein product [Didymodactylos carnosus]
MSDSMTLTLTEDCETEMVITNTNVLIAQLQYTQIITDILHMKLRISDILLAEIISLISVTNTIAERSQHLQNVMTILEQRAKDSRGSLEGLEGAHVRTLNKSYWKYDFNNIKTKALSSQLEKLILTCKDVDYEHIELLLQQFHLSLEVVFIDLTINYGIIIDGNRLNGLGFSPLKSASRIVSEKVYPTFCIACRCNGGRFHMD